MVLAPDQRPIPKEYFGLHIHKLVRPHRDGSRSVWPQIGFGTWRLSDGAKWSDFNPKPDAWNFSLLELYASLGKKYDVNVHLNLGVTPRWASARPDELGEWGLGTAAEPAELVHWEAYINELATRFKGRIHAYEIWNEPKYSDLEPTVDASGRALGSFTGSSKSMVELTKRAYLTIKSIDPQAKVVAPSPTGYSDNRVRTFLDHGGGKWVDAMSFHFYPSLPERDLLPRIAMVKRAMRDYGLEGMELWNTESGFLISGHDEIKPNMFQGVTIHTPESAAPLVARSLILGWAAGLSRYYVYAWDDGKYGLAENWNTGSPNDAGQAYEQVRRWLQESVIKRCTSTADIWMCEVERQSPRLAGRIVWTTRTSAELRVKPEWDIHEVQSLGGDVAKLRGQTVRLSGEPQLLIQERQ
ncbi:MAG: hypothetical protein ACYC05_06155 [Sulfuricella sp.]|nr:hypothetical protein [Gammaproteobacteria bacterium]